MNKSGFLKKHEKCEKTQRCHTCNKLSEKELFSVRTKLSYNFYFSENVLTIDMKKYKHS